MDARTPKLIPLSTASLTYGISTKTLARWISQQRLKAYRPTRKILVSVKEVEAVCFAETK